MSRIVDSYSVEDTADEFVAFEAAREFDDLHGSVPITINGFLRVPDIGQEETKSEVVIGIDMDLRPAEGAVDEHIVENHTSTFSSVVRLLPHPTYLALARASFLTLKALSIPSNTISPSK